MGSLQQLIDDLADESVPLSQSLRQLLTFSYRAGADTLRAWVLNELNGYPKDSEVPNYRQDVSYCIKMFYVGMGGYQKQTILSPSDLPQNLSFDSDEMTAVGASISELEMVVNAEAVPSIELPKKWVAMYAQLFEEGQASGFSMMVLERAMVQYSKLQFSQVLSRTRTEALKLSLELEKISPEMLSPEETSTDDLKRGRMRTEVLVQQFMGDVTFMQGASNTRVSGELNDQRQERKQVNFNHMESPNMQE